MRNVPYWAVLSWLLIAAIPSPPVGGGVGLDASWIWGLNLANRAGMVFGRDIGFTFGPLGHLNLPIPPEANGTEVVLYAATVYLVWVVSVVRIAKMSRLLGMSFAIVGFAVSAMSMWDQFELCLIGLAAAIVASGWRTGVLMLAMLAGAAPLFRLHQGIQAAALLLLVLMWFRNRRDYWLMPMVAIVAALGLWLYKGQTLAAIPMFLLTAVDIVGGYGEAMAVPGPLWQVLLGAGAFGLVLALSAWASPVALVPVFLIGFLAFKHGVVRQDAHVAPLHLKLALVVLLAWAATRKQERWPYFVSMAAANALLGLAICSSLVPYLNQAMLMRLSGRYPYYCMESFANFEGLEHKLTLQRPQILAPRLLEEGPRKLIGNSSIDVVPHSIDLIPANHLRWNPRPVFQSYHAYTPRLDEWNAAHYQSERRPDHIMLQWEPIDGRHPYFDEPLLWREILGRYEVESSTKQGLLLKPIGGAGGLRASAIGDPGNVQMGEWLSVPAGERVGLQADVRPNLVGRATTFALRAIPVDVEFEFEDNTLASYRTVRANLVSGPIVNPLQVGLTETKTVRRLRFVTLAPGRYESTIRIQWIRIARD